MEYESRIEKFKRMSGIYALKTFFLGIALIIIGIAMTLLLSDAWFITLSAFGFLIVLWAVSEGNPNSENL